MDFARQQLEKYGWKDGDGLGKTKSGIAKPIKASLKFDNSGLGHNIADEIINPWWQKVYDSAANNVEVKKNKDEVHVETLGNTIEITTKRKKRKKPEDNQNYGNFVKRGALTKHGEKSFTSDQDDCDEDVEPDRKKKTSGILDLTDEELFRACGGRTVHKGARHGLSMSAKLARLENQEDVGPESDPSAPRKKKKKSKR